MSEGGGCDREGLRELYSECPIHMSTSAKTGCNCHKERQGVFNTSIKAFQMDLILS